MSPTGHAAKLHPLTGLAGKKEMSPTGERAERCRWQMKRGERVAAVEKIEEKRKPEDFFGHRKRDRSGNFRKYATNQNARKPLETKGFRAFLQFVKIPLQHFGNTQG